MEKITRLGNVLDRSIIFLMNQICDILQIEIFQNIKEILKVEDLTICIPERTCLNCVSIPKSVFEVKKNSHLIGLILL